MLAVEVEVVAPFDDVLGAPPSPVVDPVVALDDVALARAVVTAVLAEGNPVEECAADAGKKPPVPAEVEAAETGEGRGGFASDAPSGISATANPIAITVPERRDTSGRFSTAGVLHRG